MSAAIAASLLAIDIVAITLILNPGISIQTEALPILVSLFLPYVIAGTLVYVPVIMLLEVYRWWPKDLRRPIEALPWFATLALLSLTGAAALFWLNLFSYSASIPQESVHALRGAAIGLTGAAATVCAVAVRVLFAPHGRRGGSAALVVLAAAVAVAVPLALRPTPEAVPDPVPLATERVEPVRNVTLIGVDGIGAELLLAGVARGKLPSYSALMKRGAFMPLATLQPTEGPPVWTSVFTGRSPRAHGVKSFLTYRLLASSAVYELLPKGAFVSALERAGLVSTAPVTAASRRVPALWTALNAFGVQTGVVRFWGTHPPEPVQGFMLSNTFHMLQGDASRVRQALYPPDLAAEVAARAVSPEDVERALVSQIIDTSVDIDLDAEARLLEAELVALALAPDISYQRAGDTLRAAYAPPFFATSFYGADVVGHSFMRFAQPDHFGDVPDDQARRYGDVIDRYADLLGTWILERATSLAPGEIVMVVSGYGMEPVPLWRRVTSILRGVPARSGTHSSAPHGFLLAFGDGVRMDARLDESSVLDIAPTVLYLMGLPIARDMEGRVLTEILDHAFARAHPVTFIPSYESLAVTPVRPLARMPDLDLPPLRDEEP
jgi:predicted AlkP superfamily phosphohydrolase/phosphomutase